MSEQDQFQVGDLVRLYKDPLLGFIGHAYPESTIKAYRLNVDVAYYETVFLMDGLCGVIVCLREGPCRGKYFSHAVLIDGEVYNVWHYNLVHVKKVNEDV